MFDIGWSELMLIGIVALIVIGPKELPTVLRTVGRTVTRVRRMAGEFQGQFQDALRDADVADMRDEITKVTETARNAMPTRDLFDPLRSVRDEIRASVTGATAALAISDSASAKTPEPAIQGAAAPVEAGAVEDDPMRAIRDEIRASVAKAVPAAPSGVSGQEEGDPAHDLVQPVLTAPVERADLPPPTPVVPAEEPRQGMAQDGQPQPPHEAASPTPAS